jgi:hypothetical protein
MSMIIPNRQPIGPIDSIVIDVGCASWETKDGKLEDSVLTLIQRFHPRVLFGFDPFPVVPDHIGVVEGTVVLTAQRAAWTHAGTEGYTLSRNCSHIGGEDAQVACFDLASFLRSLPGVETIMKIDIEGAEYELLPHLIRMDSLRNVSRILIEWHTGEYRNDFEGWTKEKIMEQLTCPVESWQ